MQPRWSPSLAFGHPLFAIALVVLIANDHFLKHAALVPSIVTGKLSDVAGLIVAPAVLAWICRARSRRAWIAAHAAIFVVFTALELSQPLCDAIGEASRAIGAPLRMWADPFDLIALPALAISTIAFGPKRELTARSRRTEWMIGAIALVACTATSQPPQRARYPFHPGGMVRTDAYVRHVGSTELPISVRRLRDEARVDCEALMDPSSVPIESGLFMDDVHWTLARGDAVPLWDRFHDAPERACYAVRLESQGRTWLLAWRHGEPPLREIPIRTEDAQEPEEGAIVIGTGEDPPTVPPGVLVRRI